MSWIDVVIPCYNYAHYLSDCVKSVLDQPVQDLRVLIIDDASRDGTPQVAEELAAQDSRITFWRHSSNRGHIATYNEGLDWASAECTLLLSADDLLTSGALSRVIELMTAHPEVGLAHGRQVLFTSGQPLPQPCLLPGDPKWHILPGADFLETCCASGSNPVATPTAVVRTWLLKALGGYRKELPHAADLELWLRCAVRGSIGILNVDQAFKRMHQKNMQLHYLGTTLGDLHQRKTAFDLFFQEYGACIPDSERLHQLATQSIAEAAFWAASRAFDRGDSIRCQELLLFALDAYPKLRSRPEWQRLHWKRRVGPRIWSVLQPVIDCLRGRSG